MTWLRSVRLEVPDADFDTTELQVSFDLKRQSKETGTSGNVSVWNLSESTADRIRAKGRKIRFWAGYVDNPGLLFDAWIRRTETERRGLDRITKLDIGEEDAAVPKRKYINIDLAITDPLPLHEIVRHICEDWIKMPVVNLNLIPADAVRTMIYNYSAWGALTLCLRSVHMRYYVEDGVIKLAKSETVATVDRNGSNYKNLSLETGMIGSPTVTDNGVRARMLLDSKINLESVVDIDSELVKGTYKVVTIVHKGSSRTGDFLTEVECVEFRS